MNQQKAPKVILIYPGIGLCGFGNKTSGSAEMHRIHHGICSIGASAKKAGYEVELIDMRRLDSWDDFKKTFSEKKADIVGITISNVDSKIALETIEIIKKIDSKIKIIVGGLSPTIFPEIYSENKKIDFIVVGEGEVAFLKIINSILENNSFPRLARGEKPDLDSLPWIDRELFDYPKELFHPFAPGQAAPSVTMLAGRGCPYQCTYCQPAENMTYGRPHRMRSPENVIAELKILKNKYNFKSITFWDDTFTVYPDWVFKFCDLYEKEKFNAAITIDCRADIICRNEKMIKRLKEVGLEWILMGVESGSQRILNFLKKGATVEQNRQAIEICKKYRIKAYTTFMLGLPTETKEEQMATINFINENRPENPSPFYFLPIKGTEIYQFCEENDLILPEYKNNPLDIARSGNFKPKIKNIDYEYLDRIKSLLFINKRSRLTELLGKGWREPNRILPFFKKKLRNIINYIRSKYTSKI